MDAAPLHNDGCCSVIFNNRMFLKSIDKAAHVQDQRFGSVSVSGGSSLGVGRGFHGFRSMFIAAKGFPGSDGFNTRNLHQAVLPGNIPHAGDTEEMGVDPDKNAQRGNEGSVPTVLADFLPEILKRFCRFNRGFYGCFDAGQPFLTIGTIGR